METAGESLVGSGGASCAITAPGGDSYIPPSLKGGSMNYHHDASGTKQLQMYLTSMEIINQKMQGAFASAEIEKQQQNRPWSAVSASQRFIVLMVHSTKTQWLIFTQILYVVGVKL